MLLSENRFVAALLIFLAVFSSWSFYLMQQQHRAKIKRYGHYPDSIAVNLGLENFDQTGFLTEIIHAKKALHYADNKTTEFEMIDLSSFTQQNIPPWLIKAPSATAYDKGQTLLVHGAVHVQQAAYLGHFATQLDTHDVTVFLDKKYLTTQAPVHLNQTGLQIDSIGAKYNYDQQVLNLFHQVRVEYQPNKRKTA